MDRLTTWRGGLIVASHDRTLLDTMSDIVALERGRWPRRQLQRLSQAP